MLANYYHCGSNVWEGHSQSGNFYWLKKCLEFIQCLQYFQLFCHKIQEDTELLHVEIFIFALVTTYKKQCPAVFMITIMAFIVSGVQY